MVIATKGVPPMRILAGLMTILLTSLLAACASSGGSSIPPPDPVQASVDDYHIGVDDQVQVSVWRNPELGITVPVRPDGKISVPLVGDVMAGGLTPAQVATDIQKKLGAYVRDPQVARSEEHTSELQSLMRISYAVFCLKKKNKHIHVTNASEY